MIFLGLSRNLCKVAFCVTGNVITDCSKNSFIMMIDVSFAGKEILIHGYFEVVLANFMTSRGRKMN